jgi:hypothetical protein
MKYLNNSYTGYKTLKEARAAARDIAAKYIIGGQQYNCGREWTTYADIYQEPDGTYSINGHLNGNAKYVMTIDKAGAKYKWQTVRRNGKESKELVKI